MKNLYKKIIQTLTSPEAKQKFIDADVKPIKWVDEFEGQYYQPEMFEGFTTPAVLVEWDIQYPKAKPAADVSLTLHIMYEQPAHADSLNKDIDKALKRFDFKDIVLELINGLESKNTGKLELISESGLKEPAIVKVHLLTFECSYRSKQKEYGEFTPDDMTLNGNIKAFDFEISE